MKRLTIFAVLMALLAQMQPASAYPCEADPLTCFRVDLSAPTTNARTSAIIGVNLSDGTSVGGPSAGNLGVFGVSHGSGASSIASYNTGLVGQGRWASTLSTGVYGLGVDTDGSSVRPHSNVLGVYGRGQNDGLGFAAGGYFMLGRSDPDIARGSAALIVDIRDGAPGDAVSIRVNGIPAITVSGDGTLTFNQGTTACPPSVPIVMGPASCIRVRTSNATYYIPAYQ